MLLSYKLGYKSLYPNLVLVNHIWIVENYVILFNKFLITAVPYLGVNEPHKDIEKLIICI